MAPNIREINRRYLKAAPERYARVLEETLISRYGKPTYPIAALYALSDFPQKLHNAFAHISFPHDVRWLAIPDLLHNEELVKLLGVAHEQVKNDLQAERRLTKSKRR